MSKLVINKINIEKSDKDIQTGISYDLSEGLNIICGNNEAGKSSLMKFIKEGFFRPVKTDTGKIYFTVENRQYRADIKPSGQKTARCKLYDNNGLEINYEIIEKFINQKYFEQGFTINLDDLMSLKYDNEISLINVIKDPSGDKLNALLQPYTSKINECIGEKGKPKKPLSDITGKINLLNQKINELSKKEDEYNNTVFNIKQTEEELKNLSEKENYIRNLILKYENDKKINEINAQIQTKNLEYNPKLYENRQKYAFIAQNVGKYLSNTENILRCNEKIAVANEKIKDLTRKLQDNFSITINKEDILNFEIDYNKISKIKALIEEISIQTSEIKAYEKNKEDVEETILKLENDYKFIQNSSKNISTDGLTELYSAIDNGLKQIKSIDFDIAELEKEQKSKQTHFIAEKIVLGFSALITACISAYLFLVNKTQYAVISTGILIFIICLILFIINRSSMKDKFERKQSLKNNITEELINTAKKYFPEIELTEGSFAIFKLDELKQNLKNTIDKITQNRIDTGFYKSKIKNTKEKIYLINNNIKEISNEIEELIKNNIAPDGKTYIETANILKDLKEEFINKEAISKEKENLETDNNIIINEFSSFLNNNSININLSSNLKENFEELRKYYEKNIDIKKEIDALNILLENLINTNKIDDNSKFSDISESSNLEYILEETKNQKQMFLEKKHALDVQKSRLEEVESIIDLKNARNIAVNEYRNVIEEIITAKSILNITSIAKRNFDKTQPDLINAQKYLSFLTNGKYTRINLEMQEITDETETVIKKWDNLSRGTKEQLYLALRLGYASNYTIKDNKRPDLPLIVDDAFVNFDAERTKSALQCLIEFSKTNQVLFFTCHTENIKKHLQTIETTDFVNFINL